MSRYAAIRTLDISNGEGIGISLFMQGCHFHCMNCFNPETWDFNGGKEWTNEVRDHFLDLVSNEHIHRVSILGGEPLCDENEAVVYELCKEIKTRYTDKKIWIYTGYTFEIIQKSSSYKREVLQYVDVLVDGPFVDSLQNFNLAFRGSSNQRLIDVPSTLHSNELQLFKTLV